MIMSRAPYGALFLACVLSLPAHAELKPQWEFGGAEKRLAVTDCRCRDARHG